MGIALNRRGLVPTRTAVFRVDAGPDTGMGHFMRCRTLAFAMIQRNWIVYFVGRGLSVDLLEFRRGDIDSAIRLIKFEDFPSSHDDVASFFGILAGQFGWLVDCVVIDTYRYCRDDFAFLQRFNAGKVPVVVIDDLADRDTPAQAVINPNPLFDPMPYERQKIPLILCGEKYTLIRPEICSLIGRQYRNDGPVLVTLGGGDVVEPMLKVLQAIPEDIGKRICVSVSGNCPRAELDEWVSRHPTERFINSDTRLFPDLLASASMALTAGGTTLWEVYALGIPSICLLWVDNQRQTSVIIKEQATSFLVDVVSRINLELKSEWLDNGLKTIVKTVGEPVQTRSLQQAGFCADEVINREKTSLGVTNSELIDTGFINRAMARLGSEPEFWQQMTSRQQKLIDGQGVKRCVDELEGLKWQSVQLFEADWRREYENW
jgi:spore coat polysaccharide biosynthesis predicted glycosyltransferase SpsG